jgi:hypothetical protein
MEEKSEGPDLRAEKRAGVMASGRKCQRARLTHTGLPKGHRDHKDLRLHLESAVSCRCHANCDYWWQMTARTEERR